MVTMDPHDPNSSVIGQVAAGIADVSVATLYLTLDRLKLVPNHVGATGYVRHVFVYRTLQATEVHFDFASIMDWRILIFFFGLWILLSCVKKFCRMFVIYLAKCSDLKLRWNTASFFVFVNVLLGYISCQVVLVFNQPPTVKQPFSNFEGLLKQLESKAYTVISPYKEQIDLFRPGRSQRFRKKLSTISTDNPPIRVKSLSEGMDFVVNTPLTDKIQYVYVATTIETDNINSLYCGVSIITDEHFPPTFITMYYRHDLSGFSWTNESTRAVIERETSRLRKKYYPKKDCGSKTKENKGSLNLEQMQTVFLVFLGISTLSIGFLITEIGAQNLPSSGSNSERKNSSRSANLAKFQWQIKQAIDEYLKSEKNGKILSSDLLRTCVDVLERETQNTASNSNIHMQEALSVDRWSRKV